MKIKIPSYPNYVIAEKAFNRDIALKAKEKSTSKGLSSELFMVLEFESGKHQLVKTIPVRYENKLFVTAFPNPVHLFLSVAIEHFNQSEKVRGNNFLKSGKKIGKDIFLLEIEENGTHDCYNHFIKYRASSIIMLVSALEAFLNHILPNNFVYSTERNGKPKEFNKKEIESYSISFKEKLIHVIPQWLAKPDFWENNKHEENLLLSLYESRKNIIHLKSNSLDDFNRYSESINKMLDLDLFNSIQACINFMNLTSDNFVEFETPASLGL